MNEKWWERPSCWVCNYWWAFLAGLVFLLSAWFARSYWLSEQLFEPSLAVEPTRVSALGTGDVQVTLTWDSYNDLDLYVIDPNGDVLFYQRPISASGGKLDVDANKGCTANITPNPVENIFWPIGVAPRGSYTIKVNYYQHCSSATLSDSYIVRLLVDGSVQEFTGTVSAVGEDDLIVTFSR